jgi:hypothetical protein
MSTEYRLVQSGKTASGGCSAGQGSSEPVAPRIIIIIITHHQELFCEQSLKLMLKQFLMMSYRNSKNVER